MERAQVIESIREVAKKTLPPRSTLLLYGSRARGEEHQGSDWDLLILLDKAELSDNDYDNVSFPFTMLGWNIGELISPQLYTKNEWASISFLPFYKNVEHDKIELYESPFGRICHPPAMSISICNAKGGLRNPYTPGSRIRKSD